MNEQMTTAQFRQWLKDMEYETKPEMSWLDKVPYDPKPVCNDLGIRQNRFYAYWRGVEKGKPVRLSPTVTRLCRHLLACHRTQKAIKAFREIHHDNETVLNILTEIHETLKIPPLESGPRRGLKSPLTEEERQEVSRLRERAVQLRRAATATTTAASKDELRRQAKELEDKAAGIEDRSAGSSGNSDE